jgi:hypothetical protein
MPIAARFHELRDRVLSAVDFKFAEPVRISFMSAGRVDTTRPTVLLEAVLRGGEGKATNVAVSASSSWRSRIVAGKAELHIDRARYAGPQPQPGDKVRALSRHGEPVWEVSGIDDRSYTRLVLQLNEL